jgi:hypothetical protein
MLVSCVAVVLFISCKKNFESINTPPKDATSAPTPQVYNMIISSLPLTGGEQSVFNSWIYPITQQAMVTSGAYPYDNARDGAWSTYYQALANYRLIQSRIDTSANPSKYNNLSAMLKTIMAYKTFKTTNYFGDMPYSKAGYAPLKGASGYKVPYDKQADIYDSIITNLRWAVDNFSTDANQYSLGAYETFLHNDIAMWIKFANSLRLYVAVTMSDKNTALATSSITEALSKPLLEDGDNIGLWPTKTPGLEFQWRSWSFSANCYLRMGSTMWNLMSSSDNKNGSGIFDPRAKIFFETNNAGEWVPYPQNPTTTTPSEGGAPYDTKRFDNWSNKGAGNIYSPVNLYFEQDTKSIPELILTAAQVHFLKAEIYNRGLGAPASSANAQTEYNAGIAASINMWTSIAFNSPVWAVNKPAAATASPSSISAVQTNLSISYDLLDPANALKQIYAQEWIDMYRQPWDAWLLLRRTGGMTPMSDVNTQYYDSNYGIYSRFTYPESEQSYNYDNWKAITGGTEVNTSKLWIAK